MKKYLIFIPLVLGLLGGFVVLLYPTISDYINAMGQSRVVADYVDSVVSMDDSKRLAMLEAAHEYNRNLPFKESRYDFTDADWAEYKELLDTGRGVMGILAIDKIDVKLPIYHGTDEGVLQVGLGHMQGTSLPVGGIGTHSVVTGHRGLPSSTLLSDLDRMNIGDTFVIYVMGETLTYEVNNTETVLPHEVDLLRADPSMDYFTLVTCTPYGVNTHRLLVRGHRVENASNAGWDALSADAKWLDKIKIVTMFMVPISLALVVYFVIRCVRIRKGGSVQR
jgi:sortase A